MKNLLVMFSCFMSYAFVISALPSLTNRCGEYGIHLRLPSDSDIIAYNKECDTVFIGPPSAGTAELVSLMPSSNLRFCASVKTLPKVANQISASIEYWTEQLAEIANESFELQREMNKKRSTLIEYEENKRALEADLEKFQGKMQEMVNKTKETKQKLGDCRELNEDVSVCADLDSEYQGLKNEIIKFREGIISPLEEEISDLDQNARILKRKLAQITDDVYANTEIFEKYKQRLATLRNEALEQYGIYGSLEGVTAQILFESNWQHQIELAKRLNRYSDIHIQSLPITRSYLQVDAVMNNSHKLNVPSALIYASLPGFTNSGSDTSTTPTGESIVNDLNNVGAPLNSFISGISGRIVLSLIGSCELTDERDQLKRNANFNDLASYITINAIHEYPMLNERRHTVYFRASRFAEEIEKRTEEGGFFHTSSTHEIIRNNFSSDDFRVDFEVDAAADAYTAQEKAILTDEAKKEVLDRVLKEIGTVSKLKHTRAIVPAKLPQSGAAMIYKEAECFGWAYCEVATFVVGVFDAIFGSKEAVTKFKARNDTIVNHSYTDRKPATYGFVTTFVSKN